MEANNPKSRRDFMRLSLVGALGVAAGGLLVKNRAKSEETLWQIDPEKCIQCGKCATACVLPVSAVKCVHGYALCGYCDLCSGYYIEGVKTLDTAAENQICPTAAIKRTFIEDPYFEFSIDEDKCIGCAKCVKGCSAFGNGSMFLQIMHDRCVNCNECAIAKACPAGAISRIPASQAYILKEGFKD